MSWYAGNTLLHFIENCSIEKPAKFNGLRIAVQCTADAEDNRKVCMGILLSGTICIDDDLMIYPEKIPTKISNLVCGYNETPEINTPANISIILNNAPEIKRGSVIGKKENGPICDSHFIATLCWLDSENSLITGKEYIIRYNSNFVQN
jgi:sulfate adenylyltransferase subunit 1